MLCESAERLPEGRDWRYELKLDGFRAIGRKSGPSAQLWSRNQKDFTRRFPGVVKGFAELLSDTIIDGEIVVLNATGKPSFDLLQGFGGEASAIVLYAFDLLMLRGKDVRSWSLEERRDRLREIVEHLPDTIRYSETFNTPLSDLVRAVRQHQLEGIVAKRVGSHYRSGEHCGDWLKWRANRGLKFVIGGYIPNGNLLDSILVGYYKGRDVRCRCPRWHLSGIPAGLAAAFRRVADTGARLATCPTDLKVAGARVLPPRKCLIATG
jgi:ATP-dependent DNA ligase